MKRTWPKINGTFFAQKKSVKNYAINLSSLSKTEANRYIFNIRDIVRFSNPGGQAVMQRKFWICLDFDENENLWLQYFFDKIMTKIKFLLCLLNNYDIIQLRIIVKILKLTITSCSLVSFLLSGITGVSSVIPRSGELGPWCFWSKFSFEGCLLCWLNNWGFPIKFPLLLWLP